MTTEPRPGNAAILTVLFGVAAALVGVGGFLVISNARAEARGGLIVRNPSEVWRMDESVATKSGRYALGRFELANIGRRPVRILSAASSCGCATPKVEPRTIEPGGFGFVEVEAIPLPSGERTATIRLQTDSPRTPEIELRFRMIGARRPPYILQVGGDLTYLGDFECAEPHTIVVITVEPRDRSKVPILRTDFPSLRFGAPVVKERPHAAQNTLQREYRFPVSFSRRPPEGVFTGEVIVVDPWDQNHTDVVHIHGEVLPALRFDPPRIILVGSGDRRSFRLTSRADIDEKYFEIRPDADSGLFVKRIDRGEDRRSLSFAVGHREGARFVPGIHNLIVQSPKDPASRVVLPVWVRAERSR